MEGSKVKQLEGNKEKEGEGTKEVREALPWSRRLVQQLPPQDRIHHLSG